MATPALRFPGEVYYLPPDIRAGPDAKTRPHILLTTCDETTEAATLAYCSTQSTEASHNAKYVLVNPGATAYRGSGLTKATYVYPSRLTLVDGTSLRSLSHAGRIIDEMPEIRLQTAEALGLGSGSCLGDRAATGTLRGRVVQLTAKTAAAIGASYALVVTEPAYAREQRYLNVVPLLNEAEYYSAPGDVTIHDGDLLSTLDWPAAIAPVSWVEAVFFSENVEQVVACAVDDGGMDVIDRELKRHLVL